MRREAGISKGPQEMLQGPESCRARSIRRARKATCATAKSSVLPIRLTTLRSLVALSYPAPRSLVHRLWTVGVGNLRDSLDVQRPVGDGRSSSRANPFVVAL